jgi:hypothetical protein
MPSLCVDVSLLTDSQEHERKDSNAHLAAHATYVSDCSELTIGLGSVGLEIFSFLPELVLLLGSELAGVLGLEEFRLNHFEGLERNWVKPEEGEVERGNERNAGEGADEECVKGSWGLNVLADGAPRRGAMLCGWMLWGKNEIG